MSKSQKEEMIQDHSLETAEEVTSVVLAGSDQVDLQSIMERSRSLSDAQPTLTLTSKYAQFDKIGDKFRGIFHSFCELTVKDAQTDDLKTIKGVRLINDGQIYVHGGANLLRQLEAFNIPAGQALDIEYVEKSGNVKVFSITLLR